MIYTGKTFSKKELESIENLCKLPENYNQKYFNALDKIELDLKEKKKYTCLIKEITYSRGYSNVYYKTRTLSITRETNDFYVLTDDTRISKSKIYAIGYR